jgi:hypothetical protein
VALGVTVAEIATLACAVWVAKSIFVLETPELRIVTKTFAFLLANLAAAVGALALGVPAWVMLVATVVGFASLFAVLGAMNWVRQALEKTGSLHLDALTAGRAS